MKKFLVLAAFFCTVFTSYAVRYGYGILLPYMLVSLDITKTQAGVIYSSFFIAYTIGSPVLGLLFDRLNARWLLAIFVAVLGAGAFLMQYASSIAQASVFYTLAGIGSAACWAPVMSLAQRWTSREKRGQVLALIDTGSATGIMATGTLIPLIAVAFSWQVGWRALGILGFAVAALLFLTVRQQPPQPPREARAARQPTQSVGATLKVLVSDVRFWLLGLAYLLTGFAILIPFTFLSTYAVQELDFSYGLATSLITVIGAGAVVGKVTLGPLSDKVGRIKVMMLCTALIAVGCVGLVVGQVAALYAAIFVFSLGYGAVWAMYAAAASDYFPAEFAGTTVGLWTLFLGIGSIIAPIISGWTADRTGTLSWSFVLAAGGAVVALLFLLPIWRRAPSRANQAGGNKVP